MATVTPARLRALRKAHTNGFIMRPGGFCEDNPMLRQVAIEDEAFDSRQIIDALVDDKLLTFGEGSNQFVLTAAGTAAVESAADSKKRQRKSSADRQAIAA